MTEAYNFWEDSIVGIFISLGWGLWIALPFTVHGYIYQTNMTAVIGGAITFLWLTWIFWGAHMIDKRRKLRPISPTPFSISTWIPGREVDVQSEGE